MEICLYNQISYLERCELIIIFTVIYGYLIGRSEIHHFVKTNTILDYRIQKIFTDAASALKKELSLHIRLRSKALKTLFT